MTRAAAVMGALLAVVSIAGGIQAYAQWGGGRSLAAGLVGGAVLGAGAVLTWRRVAWAQIGLSVLGLLYLARFLPHFFITKHFWPDLPLLLLGSFTVGLGVLGFMLDRYSPEGGSGGEQSRL
jgi:uncharacterized membrane protein (UPF0136 family)